MKSFESVLGEIERDRRVAIFVSLGDADSVKENIKEKFNESIDNILLLFEYGQMDARGYFVKTKSRVLFCLTQNINKFKNSFEIKWVIDDIKNTTFDIKPLNENEIQISENKEIMFDGGLYSSERLLRELHNIIFPPKTEISDEVKKEVKIHPKVWTHIEKMYDFYYGNMFKDVLLSLPLKVNVTNVTRQNLVSFLLALSLEDSLIIIKDILDNENIKRDKNNTWNEYGDYIKNWRPQLIDYLKDIGIEYDESTKTFSLVGGEPIQILTTRRKLSSLIDMEFSEFFYDSLKKEINDAYRFGLYTSTMFLSRKLLENLVIETLRIKYPPNITGNLELYYNEKDQRFNDFTILIKNLESKIDDFGIDKNIISEFISLIKPFRPRANSNTHSIIIIADEEEVLRYSIQKMAALLLKLWNNLKLQNANSISQ